MKHFGLFILGVSIAACLIFAGLLATLLQNNKIEFTDETTITEPILLATDPMEGSDSPQVIIVIFGDFSSEISADLFAGLSTIVEEYANSVMVVWKDFSNETLDPESGRAAIAARCAQKQSAFFPYAEMLMEHQYDLGDELYLGIARELGLREGSFTRCLKKEKTRELVEESLAQVEALDLTAAPTTFIDGERVTGAISVNELRTRINLLIGS
ncbi:MAG: thioredoxin domain-containing protein [Patescibacteria group bacterium]|jgi:protein-disulfide isomerase